MQSISQDTCAPGLLAIEQLPGGDWVAGVGGLVSRLD